MGSCHSSRQAPTLNGFKHHDFGFIRILGDKVHCTRCTLKGVRHALYGYALRNDGRGRYGRRFNEGKHQSGAADIEQQCRGVRAVILASSERRQFEPKEFHGGAGFHNGPTSRFGQPRRQERL